MNNFIKPLFGILLLSAFGACNFSNATPEVPIAIKSTDTAFAAPTSTSFFVSTVDPLTPTAVAQFFHTLEAITVIPETPTVLTYEDCGSGWASWKSENWTLCSGFENPITIMHVSGKVWQFSYDEYYGKDVRNLCTRLHHMTKDETYLYFSLDPDCELIEPGFVISVGMFRMNLLNGEVIEVLKTFYDFETYNGNYYSASISPTGRRIAYIYPQESPLAFYILDLQTGENRSFPLEENYGGGGMFSWSEDGTKLVFMLESEKDNNHYISMVFLDLLKDNSMVTFIKEKEFSWISSRLEVTDNWVKITPHFDTPLLYDIETGILSPITQ